MSPFDKLVMNGNARRARNAASRPPIIPRALVHKEAAGYCGLSIAAFDSYRRRGLLPGPTLPGKRYDMELIDNALNKLSGIGDSAESMTALQEWRRARGARKS
jgi:hypothetical protein